MNLRKRVEAWTWLLDQWEREGGAREIEAVAPEESGGSGTSMYGSVHKYGPTDHQFEPDTAAQDRKREARNRASRIRRAARHEALTSLGLKRVKGALGGTYYE